MDVDDGTKIECSFLAFGNLDWDYSFPVPVTQAGALYQPITDGWCYCVDEEAWLDVLYL